MTVKLLKLAVTEYEQLDGYAVAHGMPELESLPLRRLINYVYWYFTRNFQDQTELQKFRAQVWQPPKGTAPDRRSPWSAEAEQAAFGALKGRLGTGNSSAAA